MGEKEIIFIDANIFLEIALKDEKAESCKNFLRKVKNREVKAATSDFILYTCLIQLENKLRSSKALQEFIFFVNEHIDLEILRPNIKEVYDATTISERFGLDFDDSLIVSCMLNYGIETIISLDKHFDKIKFIKRKVP